MSKQVKIYGKLVSIDPVIVLYVRKTKKYRKMAGTKTRKKTIVYVYRTITEKKDMKTALHASVAYRTRSNYLLVSRFRHLFVVR